MQKVFKYKLDFYYQQTLIALVTLIVYAGIKGSFIEDHFSFVFKDPIVYIIIFYFFVYLIVLILNLARDRKLVVSDEEMIFHHKYGERKIRFSDIEWMHIGRERLVQTAGRFQLIVFKLKNRRRLFRIRVGRYEHNRDLVSEMEKIAERVPKGRRRAFSLRRRKTV